MIRRTQETIVRAGDSLDVIAGDRQEQQEAFPSLLFGWGEGGERQAPMPRVALEAWPPRR